MLTLALRSLGFCPGACFCFLPDYRCSDAMRGVVVPLANSEAFLEHKLPSWSGDGSLLGCFYQRSVSLLVRVDSTLTRGDTDLQ